MKHYSIIDILFIACLLPLMLLPACGEDIIIETRKGGKNVDNYAELSGNWSDSDAKSRAIGLSAPEIGSRFAVQENAKEAQARFETKIPKTGTYQISTTWGTSGNARNVKYIIKDDTREHLRYLDQAGFGAGVMPSNAHMWHNLGIYDFEEGSQVSVVIDGSEVNGRPAEFQNGRIYADAVRLRFIETAPPQTGEASPFEGVVTPTPIVPSTVPTPIVTAAVSPIPTHEGSPTEAYMEQSEIDWMDDYATALAEARRRQKSILIFFHYPPASSSQSMLTNVLEHPKVVQELDRFICLRLNPVESSRIANYYSVVKAPVILILNSEGYLQGRLDDYAMVPVTLNFLAKH